MLLHYDFLDKLNAYIELQALSARSVDVEFFFFFGGGEGGGRCII